MWPRWLHSISIVQQPTKPEVSNRQSIRATCVTSHSAAEKVFVDTLRSERPQFNVTAVTANRECWLKERVLFRHTPVVTAPSRAGATQISF